MAPQEEGDELSFVICSRALSGWSSIALFFFVGVVFYVSHFVIGSFKCSENRIKGLGAFKLLEGSHQFSVSLYGVVLALSYGPTDVGAPHNDVLGSELGNKRHCCHHIVDCQPTASYDPRRRLVTEVLHHDTGSGHTSPVLAVLVLNRPSYGLNNHLQVNSGR